MGLFDRFRHRNDDDDYEVDEVTTDNTVDEAEDGNQYVDVDDEPVENYDDYGYATDEDDSEEEEELDPEDQYYEQKDAPSSVLGQPSLLNIVGPSYFSTDDLMSEEFVMRETMKHRTYGIAAYVPPSGYPRMLDTNVFQELQAQGNVDLTLDVVPQARRDTMKELSNQLNIIRANAEFQNQQGQTFQLRENITKFNDIDTLLDQVQFDENRIYDVVITLIVYGDSERDMNRNFGTVEDLLANQGISITPYAKRVKSGYLQTVPLGARMYNLDDTYRNVDRRSLAVLDIARNAAGRFNGGIPFGTNQATPSQNTEFLNIFGTNTHRPINYNMGIVGESGVGSQPQTRLKWPVKLPFLVMNTVQLIPMVNMSY